MAKNKSPLLRYPWASLYDIESGVRSVHQPGSAGRTSRPGGAVNRVRTSVMMSDEEKRIYDRVAYTLSSKMHPIKVTKSQVLGLALRLLDAQVEALPRSLDSWETLATELFHGLENENA